MQCEDKSLGRDATAADPRAWRDRPAPSVQGSEQTVEESAATSTATIDSGSNDGLKPSVVGLGLLMDLKLAAVTR